MQSLTKGIIFLSVIFSTLSAIAQNNVRGTVVDNTNIALPGVTILVKGTTQGLSTDFDGNFSITEGIDSNSILIFSYVGFKTQEIKVGNQAIINVQMEEDTSVLEEVVLVGYGSQVKKDITGSVSTLKSEAIESRPNTQIGALIQGQAAGVQVLSNSGKPSDGFSVRIRGTNSINAGSEPLYVVDGVPTTNTRAINPQDIETFTILKDASSTAIYGAQGANGVVLITTKRGTTETPLIMIDTYVGFSQVWRTLSVLNGEQYRDLMTEFGLTTNWDNFTARTDWQQEVFQNGLSQNYQFAISGRKGGTNYYVSVGHTAQEGAVRSAELERTNFKINLDQKINDWLKIGTRVAYTAYNDVDVNDNNNVNQGGVLLGALTTPSIIDVFNPDGTFTSNPFQNWENPLASTDGLDREFTSQRFLANLYVEAKFLKHVKYKVNFGVDRSNGIFDSFLDPFRTTFGAAIGGQSINNTNSTKYFILDNTITYNNTFKEKHKVEALVGSVIQKTLNENSSIETRNFPSDAVSTPNAGAIIQSATAFKDERANASFLGRINYAYDNKYLLTANFRADGSNNFGPDNRWGFFPSLSAGWRVSNEEFLQNINLINDLKVRLGWGIVGNDQIGSYAFLGRVGFGANYPFNQQAQPGSFPSNLGNPELRWEESEQINFGLDLTILDNRLSFTFDTYLKKTRDLLLDVPLPTSTGFSSVFQNVGELENRGIELSLQYKAINTESLQWNTNFNISFNENEVISIIGPDIIGGEIAGGRGFASRVTEGQPLGIIYGYEFGGVDPRTGNAYYIDSQGNSTFNPNEDTDRTIIGDANPDFIYGISNDITYKNFNLSLLLEGSYGGEMLNVTRMEMEGMTDPKNQSTAVLNRWRNPGDITNIPRASFGNTDNSRISTRFIEDASYLRFKAITISYEFPLKWIEKFGLSGVRLYATGENIFTLTNYTGLDPEVNAFGGSNSVKGIDFGTYPQTRNIIVGANLKF